MGIINKAETIVVKVGSHLVVEDNFLPNERFFKALAADIDALLKKGKKLLLVSSGAVALGARKQGVDYPRKLASRQALAAIGQIELCGLWRTFLSQLGRETAQVLLTFEDSEARRRYLNARSTLDCLFAMGVVAIINENDTVATDELRFGDNDRLAARVAQMVSADCLILLSTVDGFYESDPKINKSAKHIPVIKQIDEDIVTSGGEGEGKFSTGGMKAKLQAAEIAIAAGCDVVICGGATAHPLLQLERGARHTLFPAGIDKLTAHKRWIAGLLTVSGEVVVDDGAARALKKGGSLLAVGTVSLKGAFERGDLVLIKNSGGKTIGRGLAGLGRRDAEKVLGLKSEEVAARLGFEGREELIHRNNMLLEGG